MNKKQNTILIVNEKVIKLVKKLMDEGYRREGFTRSEEHTSELQSH